MVTTHDYIDETVLPINTSNNNGHGFIEQKKLRGCDYHVGEGNPDKKFSEREKRILDALKK